MIKNKTKASLIIFIATFVASLILICVGFIIPPTGVIDSSVITAVGELLGFAVVGQLPALIDKGYKIKVIHKDTTIEADDNNE